MRRTISACFSFDTAFAALGLAIGGKLRDDVIAVGVAAAGHPGLDTPAQTAASLVGEVLEVERPHRTLEADMELADLALGQGDDPHAGKAQALVDAGNVFLVARQTVERLGQDDLDLSALCVAQERLDAGPHQARTGNPVVGVVLMDRPAFAGSALFAEPDLILDGRLALLVGRVTGVDSGLGHDAFSGGESSALALSSPARNASSWS
jgi:hypothetical protein